jgi:ABC-2 type transport system ATP-binding protein
MMVEVNNLTKIYGKETVLDNVSFTLNAGEVLGVVGPNGCGKSTLFGIMLGLREASSGYSELFGERDIQKVKSRIGVAMDQGSFYNSFSARRNLLLSAQVKGADASKIDEYLQRVDLAHTGSKAFKKFSYGMKKRLEIADAMLNDPDLYIFDEPTNGLDPDGIVFIRQTILALREQGKTVIVSSHYLQEIEKVCTKLIMLRKGRILYNGGAAELREKHGDLEEFFLNQKG